MELRRHSCVLPSNAPAFDSFSSRAVTGRVLQERCGNRQHEYLDSDITARRKYFPASPVENLYRNGISTYVSSHHGGIASHPDCKSEEQINRETQKVWRLLQRCGAYCKYRDKPTKDTRELVKWPEHMEYAFFRGLVKYEPMGRRKLLLDGKPRGRNELVADSIEKDTGEARTRKQVSSHIQVLKDKLKDEPLVLKYMSKDDLSYRPRHAAGHGSTAHSRHAANSARHRQPSTQFSFQPDFRTATSNRYFTPYDFEMYVRDTQEDPPKHIYTFTKFPKDTSPKLPDVHVHDTRHWRTLYPTLSHVPLDRFADCDIIVCDASISVMTDTLPKDAELAIQLELRGEAYHANFSAFVARTSLFSAASATRPSSATKINTLEPDAELGYNSGLPAHFTVPFCSKFWAQKIHSLNTLLRRAQAHHDAAERAKMEAQVRASLERLTATQEIFAVPKGGENPVRVAAILWRFSQTHRREEGRAVWRSVVYSPAQHQQQHQTQQVLAVQPAIPGTMVEELYPVSQHPPTAYPALSFDLPPHHQQQQHPLYDHLALPDAGGAQHHHAQFDLDALSAVALHGAFALASYPAHSGSQGLPSLTHSYDSSIDLPPPTQHQSQSDHNFSVVGGGGGGGVGGVGGGMSHNELDFTGGSISIHLEPAIDLPGYHELDVGGGGVYNAPLGGFARPEAGGGGHGQQHNAGSHTDLFTVESAFARPWGTYQELMERLEGCETQPPHGGVGQEHGQQGLDAAGGHEAGGGGEGGGLWKLQSPFAEETGEEGSVKEEEEGSQGQGREDGFDGRGHHGGIGGY
ncbi:uncharacterized protein BDZ99DRAFT_568162 [Mytilinidion resinicola]|uniref:TEA domain-containing protein n=1 Tax=Mytilinidion resinicola TaxID=574789 RepID=A0A6A6YWC0_9PEZI|nr:uncharacterized protein BDZ99DRAFT_568162 [Mytilinidion resinicola]KAF2812848.1 hypothetical protein BDZ99DRAFT_568162 [Mytilinidion resinicola]